MYEIERSELPAGNKTFEICSIGPEGDSCDGLMNKCTCHVGDLVHCCIVNAPCSADCETKGPSSPRQ